MWRTAHHHAVAWTIVCTLAPALAAAQQKPQTEPELEMHRQDGVDGKPDTSFTSAGLSWLLDGLVTLEVAAGL